MLNPSLTLWCPIYKENRENDVNGLHYVIGGRGMRKRSGVILRKGNGRERTQKLVIRNSWTQKEKLVIQNNWEEKLCSSKTVEKITLKLILFFYTKPFCKFHALKPVLFFVFVKSLRISLFKVQPTLHVIVDSHRYCNSVIKQTWFLLERKDSRTKDSSAN